MILLGILIFYLPNSKHSRMIELLLQEFFIIHIKSKISLSFDLSMNGGRTHEQCAHA